MGTRECKVCHRQVDKSRIYEFGCENYVCEDCKDEYCRKGALRGEEDQCQEHTNEQDSE